MASSASSPILNIILRDYRGSLVATLPYPYFSKLDTQQAEVWEIIDPEQEEGDILQGSFAMSAKIEDVLRYFLGLGAIIESPSKVRDYLYRYPDIAKLACFVAEKVYRTFDYNAQLYLNVNNDDDPESEYLVLLLRVPNYDETVMDKIVKIQESYYDSLSQMTGWFLFTTDFSLPR